MVGTLRSADSTVFFTPPLEAASTTAAWKQCTVALDVISVILVASDRGWGNHDIGSGRRTIPTAMGQDRSYCRGRDIGDPDILADHIPDVPVPTILYSGRFDDADRAGG
jgi:hypothetical protein